MPSSLFSSKGKKPKDIKVIVINRFDREEFFRSLREFGWEQTEGPFEFELKWKHDRIRKSAREHAAEIEGDILIEIRDKDYSTNPYNDYVFYIWKGTPGVRGIPPPPSYQQSTGFALAQQIQMQQAQARVQHARAMKQMVPPAPQVPQAQIVSSGGTCPKCSGNQVQYFNNSIAKCPQCGSNFKWQMPAAQPQPPAAAPPPQPIPPRPPPQVQVPQQQPAAKPPTPAPQQPQAQPQQPVAPQPQPQQPAKPQPSVPQQPQAQPQQPVSYCPKCRVPLTKQPDGRMICTTCGLGQ